MMSTTDPHTLDHIRKAANLLPTLNRTQLLLKSYYLTLASKHACVADNKRLTDDGCCRKCSSKWQDQQYQLHLRPGGAVCRRGRNIVKRSEAKQDRLSKSHSILAKKYLKPDSTLVKLTCRICNTKKNIVLRLANEVPPKKKPMETHPDAGSRIVDLDASEMIQKKRKKTEKNAGLTIPVSQPSTQPTPSYVPAPSAVMRKPEPKPTKHTPSAGQRSKKTSKLPKHLSIAAQKTADAKQRNNMLLLANILKTKSSGPIEPMRNLQSMLRK